MIPLPDVTFKTVDEFLDWVERQPVRYEFIGGRVYPVHGPDVTGMVGGSVDHGRISRNIGAWLWARLRGTGCAPYGGDVGVVADGELYFPDVSVACGPVAGGDRRLHDPVAIFEVLSPTTQRRDRVVKNTAYRQITALRHYILVESDDLLVECMTRRDDGGWDHRSIGGEDGVLELSALGLSLPLCEIYEETDVLRLERGELPLG